HSVAVILIIFLAGSLPAHACEKFQVKADRYATLKRQGGSAKQMNRWNAQKKLYSERYRECLKAQPRIHAAGGTTRRQSTKAARQPHRVLVSENPVTRQLLTTCNFWIDAYNGSASPENKSYRDSACRALDEAIRNEPVPVTQAPAQRPAKDCVKPGNLFDDDVRECMAGSREPDWRQPCQDCADNRR